MTSRLLTTEPELDGFAYWSMSVSTWRGQSSSIDLTDSRSNDWHVVSLRTRPFLSMSTRMHVVPPLAMRALMPFSCSFFSSDTIDVSEVPPEPAWKQTSGVSRPSASMSDAQ